MNRAFWGGVTVGAVLVLLVMWLWSKWSNPDPNPSPEPESLPSYPPVGFLGAPKTVPTA